MDGKVITGKALAGFVDTKDGRHLAIAVFINLVPVKELGEEATQLVGEAVGEIAAAAYDGLPPTEKRWIHEAMKGMNYAPNRGGGADEV
jgi:hypothetical protein